MNFKVYSRDLSFERKNDIDDLVMSTQNPFGMFYFAFGGIKLSG